MSAPPATPASLSGADRPTLEQLMPGGRVWVFYAGGWRPGVVLNSSPEAAVVRYRPTDGSATAVDTIMSRNLAPRVDADPYLDTPALRPSGLPMRAPGRGPVHFG